SSGIGAAVARQLVLEGAAVALVARRDQELASVVASLPEERRAAARVYVHDVTDFDATPALFERIDHDLGGLDLLVYAAGAMSQLDEGEYDFDADRRMVDVNLVGAMAWMNLAAARFEAARAGTIVGVSSIAGVRGRRKNPAYCASKAALTTYLESLRNRLARYGVTVVTAKPGFVDTAMTRGMKGLFWLVSAERAASITLDLARRTGGADAFVPARWSLVAAAVAAIPSVVFRRLDI
ncbi:MAG TPA: SDR family NAD(P)-dependent oxidoreductase, partial [Byssovorax sp.]